MTQSPPAPLTRESLIDTMLAYRRTALLRAGLELRVFDALAEQPADATAVAARLGVRERGARILLGALAAVGLLVTDGPRFALPDGAHDLLVSTAKGYVGAGVQVAASQWEWDALGRLTQAVRSGGPVTEADAEAPGFPFWQDFAERATFATDAGAAFLADQLRPWAERRDSLDVLDIGCGHGLFGFAVAKLLPAGRVWSLDWPEVLPIAARNAERAGLAGRAEAIAGDAFQVPLGGPYDVVVLGNLLFQFSERRAAELLARAAAAVKPDGQLVIVGFTTGDAPPERNYGAQLISLLMLLWTAEGEAHSTAAYEKLLTEQGFTDVAVCAKPGVQHRVIRATR
ncbi:class I SAM-dependent methyltransferase [Kutzneria sp. NPDC051319]|uniref:class I SAM-dependent methyltransferase n=1 Tax=Kutzneria sp. NPDC051319 TaxID=3155047 RepID=UPI0034378F6F